jgi:serine phosphatase RsbU (regulator of sigma subunit)
MKNKGLKISQSFQRWLLVLVVIAFFTSTAFLWFSQTSLSEDNTYNLLKLNISDVQQDIKDLSDENLLRVTRRIAKELNKIDKASSFDLMVLADKHSVPEINLVDINGLITASTNPTFVDFNMGSGTQSGAFMVLLEEQNEFVQSYQPLTYNENIWRKYAGVALRNGGFVQVGYDSYSFHEDVADKITQSTRNRHIGENGSIVVADEKLNIISNRGGYIGSKLPTIGIVLDSNIEPETLFTATVHGVPSYCMYAVSEGSYIIAVMPQSEAVLSRNVSVGITTVMEVIIFFALFVLIYFLIKKLIVNNIERINDSLAKITDGDLNEIVDVRSHVEFASLSDDINSTVDTLKKYIADAAARIDAELAFAKAIQHSALPSVFPPFPTRKEFDIWATMDTAKEVGGDFYDFYFVNKDTLAFLIADVSGKGIPAAMFMMNAKAVLKSYAESGLDVNKVFTLTNEKLCEGNDAGMFVTAWMGFLNTETGEVTFANAGHNPPLVRHADGSFEYLKVRAGFVLAGMEGVKYRKNELQLAPGDVIYLYTDGVTEATNINDELYGEDRLLALLNANKEASMEELCKLVKEDVFVFAGEAPQFDDITMLALKYCGATALTNQEEAL